MKRVIWTYPEQTELPDFGHWTSLPLYERHPYDILWARPVLRNIIDDFYKGMSKFGVVSILRVADVYREPKEIGLEKLCDQESRRETEDGKAGLLGFRGYGFMSPIHTVLRFDNIGFALQFKMLMRPDEHFTYKGE
jgi:hypothetical protein